MIKPSSFACLDLFSFKTSPSLPYSQSVQRTTNMYRKIFTEKKKIGLTVQTEVACMQILCGLFCSHCYEKYSQFLQSYFLPFSNWMDFQVKGTSLSRALQCWDKSLQEANKNSKTALKGCPFHLIDNCQWPQCNPTCPALIDQATQQEMTLLQVLASMGLDLQKLGLDASGDISASMVSNGG